MQTNTEKNSWKHIPISVTVDFFYLLILQIFLLFAKTCQNLAEKSVEVKGKNRQSQNFINIVDYFFSVKYAFYETNMWRIIVREIYFHRVIV